VSLLRDHPPGHWRLTLSQERVRRRRDARSQPRTKIGWWTFLREPRARRVALNAEARREYEERDWELQQEEAALQADLARVQAEIARDRYDRGRPVSARELARHRAHQTDRYGRRYQLEVGAGNTGAITAAREEARQIRAALRKAREERLAVHDALIYGETPRLGEFRRRHGLR